MGAESSAHEGESAGDDDADTIGDEDTDASSEVSTGESSESGETTGDEERVGDGDGDGDGDGCESWVRQLGTGETEIASAVATDNADGVYVAGYTERALDDQASLGGRDMFVIKYDSAGSKEWTRQLGTSGNDRANSIATDSANHVYVLGDTNGVFEGQPPEGDMVLAKYDASGDPQWTLQFGNAAG